MDQNLETKNEYLLKKEERKEIAKIEKRKRTMKSLVWWLAALAILVLFSWWIYDYFKTASTQDPTPGQYFEAQSRDHIAIGKNHPVYNSNPPTGGWHYDQPAQTGIYDTELLDEQLVHNLEHSHIWIAYRPDLSAEDVEMLANIAKDYGSKIVMTKRPANDSQIALTAWEHLLKMDNVDEALIRNFIDAYRGIAGPEKLPDFGFDDFRKNK
ncbi:MAG: hypothetical protein A3J46_06335 [Candidatus Yanofskybacteria bacterium RIFCSPHIGHO2_02_FULL_41_11]|uniref:DUF3105 domain-containing protein n=1 Tax=Candidatus Yanofskybacteria bacterium RIFCSPHIGHO2_02_FULL_41_11 TaxID=1802675 RepID=A0A1F8F799_9BACT|nr:MAG: hypothetical protein A3J46_06335 [Candidatus Yanofskybacteria bacterium RIFCSPHIGHO2_02_FULL_41_11]